VAPAVHEQFCARCSVRGLTNVNRILPYPNSDKSSPSDNTGEQVSTLRVLTYHRIGRPEWTPHLDPRLLSATPETFARQMSHLAKHYNVVSAEMVLHAIQSGSSLPPRAVLITFDDAYTDFLEYAWPTLRHHRLAATLFVPTAYPGCPERGFWSDRLYTAFTRTAKGRLAQSPIGPLQLRTQEERITNLRRVQAYLKDIPHDKAAEAVDQFCAMLADGQVWRQQNSVLSWDQLRELSRAGITLASHTRTHPILTQLGPQKVREEIDGSQKDLLREIGAAPPIFCYPNGSHNAPTRAILKEEGFVMAFTAMDGHNDLRGVDPLRLRRTNITRRTSPAIFALRLHRVVTYFDMWRHHRRQLPPVLKSAVLDYDSARGYGQPKVAYIMSRFPKLTETFVLYEILAVEKLGLHVEVYPLLREREPVVHSEAEDVVSRAHYRPFLSLPILRAQWHFLCRRPIRYLQALAEVLWGTRKSANFFFGALAIFPKSVRFAYEMARNGITHVHAHFCTHPAIAALIVHRLVGIPFSFTAHGSDLHIDCTMLREKLEAADFAVACSSFNKTFMVTQCGEEVGYKIHVIRHGIEPDIFSPISTSASSSPCRLVCVGSFLEVKGHRYLIEACRHLRDRGMKFECHLVGDGPLRAEIEAHIAKAGLKDRFVLHGLLRRNEVAQILRSSDLKVVPSVPTVEGKREGLPNVVVEAMSSGLPVVSTTLSGIPEAVETGRTGILVPPRDAVALADALGQLIEDPELARRMGAAGREKVLREYNRTDNAAQLIGLFGGALPSQQRAHAITERPALLAPPPRPTFANNAVTAFTEELILERHQSEADTAKLLP